MAKEISGRGRRRSREKGNQGLGDIRFINISQLFFTIFFNYFTLSFFPYFFPDDLYPRPTTFSYTRQVEPSEIYRRHTYEVELGSTSRRHAGGKDWDYQYCRTLLFSYRNSIRDSTGGHVAGASAAYENQA